MGFYRTRFNKDEQINLDDQNARGNQGPIKGSTKIPKDKPVRELKDKFSFVETFSPRETRETKDTEKETPTSKPIAKLKKKYPPKTMAKYFREVPLTEEQRKAICLDIHEGIDEWKSNRGNQEANLQRWNDLVEGIVQSTDFPWEGAANYHVPLTEIQMNICHSAIRQTMLKNDSMWMVEYYGLNDDMLDRSIAVEQFMNFKCRTEIPIKSVFSDIAWNAQRDGTTLAQAQWVDERKKMRKLMTFITAEEFQGEFPDKESAGLSSEKYSAILEKLYSGQETDLEIEVEVPVYVGPLINTIDLNDFVMAPITVSETRFARLVGKRFTIRLSHAAQLEKSLVYRKGTYEELKKVKNAGRKDSYTEMRDEIEGISRNNIKDEIEQFDGIHRFDLDGDGIEEDYICIFNDESRTLCQYWYYPYNHGKDCFIPCRIQKRPNRFNGRGIPERLEDTNLEINCLHNQRTNSRTITTVPTFKAKLGLKKEFDPTRKDQRFIPGRVFYLSDMAALQQFDVRETDFSESQNEEAGLFSVADQTTGASQLRSGRESRMDPRAPALKVQTLLQQSNIRLDDFMEELAGESSLNEGLNAIGWQIFELYKQFGENEVEFPVEIQPRDITTPQTPNQFGRKIQKLKLSDIATDEMKISISKTSVSQNPDIQFQKWYILYGILSKEPLVGGNEMARRQLLNELLAAARAESIRRFLPPSMENKFPQQQLLGATFQGMGAGAMGASAMPQGGQIGTTGIGEEGTPV